MSNWPTNGNLTGKLSIGQGEPGKSLEYEWRGTELGIRQEGEEEYQFVNLAGGGAGSSGTDGREIELQVNNGYIQWRYVGEETWNNLISMDSLKGSKGDKGEKGEQGLQGLPGKDGTNGKDGVTPNITIGTVTTLEAGQQATVVNSGTKENPIFDFGIPKGENGSDGADGITPDMSDFENKINKQYETIEKKIYDHIENHPEGGGVAKSDKVDYMGKQHGSLKNTNDANVEYLLRKTNIQKYEGSSITANNTYMKQVNNVILKGVTKFKDLDTGDFIDRFEEGKNLELVGSKGNSIQIKNKLNLKDLIYITSKNGMSYTINNNTINLSNSAKWGRVIFNFDYQPGVVYNITFVSNITGAFCIDFNKDNSNRTIFSKEAVSKDFTPSGGEPLLISNINTGKMQLSDFYICKAQYKNEPYKSSQLISPIENPLYSIGDVYDYIDFKTGLYVKNIGIRRYQEGDESNSEVLTDKRNTIYKLEQPIVSKIDLQGQKIYSYDGTTYYNCISEVGYPSPILSMEVPTDLASLVNSQKTEIKMLNKENEKLTQMDNELVATSWDMDFRMCAIEWSLEDLGIGQELMMLENNMKGSVSNMALSRYEQAKIMIVGGVYKKITLTKQLTTYLNRGYLTQEEYDELIALMEAKDLVVEEQ